MNQIKCFAAVIAAMLATSEAWAMPPNDECASAAPISGNGKWYVQLNGATVSTTPSCFVNNSGDVWFCWTPTWTGSATIGGFYLLPNGTDGECYGVQVWDGCGCPPTGAQLGCGQTCQPLTINIECNHRYLIRVVDVYSGLGVPGATLTITPGPFPDSCPDQPADGSCPDCCGAAPRYTDASFSSMLDGRLAIETHANYFESDANDIVIRAKDLNITPCPTAGGDWIASTALLFPPNAATTDWTRGRIGTVFATTFDDQGNLYVGRFNGWIGVGTQGTIGGKATSIIKLSTNTPFGSASVFATLPDPSPALPPGNDVRPGIGDVVFDCESQSLFASHLSDGRIYRISDTGVVLGWYDHATGTVGSGTTPDCTTPGPACDQRYGQFAPLGERVWALKPHNGRLYYSVWGQDGGQFINTAANQIWSVALSSGIINPATRRMELQMPTLPLIAGWNTNDTNSNPVADIEFTSTCRMLLAERSMYSNLGTNAHRSRLIEYIFDSANSAWVPTANYNSAAGFSVGVGGGANCAGGCDVDLNTTGGQCSGTDGRLWASGDYLGGTIQFAYGITGINPNNAGVDLLIDYNNANDGGADKTKQGDVEIPCAQRCATLEGRVTCQADEDGWTGNYIYTFTITNNSGRPVTSALFPSSQVSPNSVPLHDFGGGALPPGATSDPIAVTISGPFSGGTFTLPVILYTPGQDGSPEVCCNITEELTLPDCTCFQVTAGPTISCVPGMPGQFTVNFTLQTLAYDIGHVFITSPTSRPLDLQEFIFWGFGVTAGPTPGYFPINIPAGNTQSFQFSLTLSAAGGDGIGTTQCVEVYTHTPDLAECCMREVCFVVPDCLGRGGPECGSIDFNNDTSFFDPLDIDAFLSVYAEGPCVPPEATCNSIDFNSDGSLFDPCDINSFLTVYSEGPCTPCGQ